MPNIPNGSANATQSDVPPDDDAVVLRAAGIEKRYDSTLPLVGRTVEVLTGADLELRPGEVVGIVGENGSGKSTLLKVLVGALRPDAGEVRRTGTVGWCPQETLLYDRLTVRETFELFGEAYGMDDRRVRERRDHLADRLDFAGFLDYRIDHLSGGNRQKVNLAVALLHDPDVLLLDEPYTGFDWETYLAFWDLTEELVAGGTAIAVISHLVSERERFDRILELRDGTLHEQSDPSRKPRSAAHGGDGPVGGEGPGDDGSGSAEGEVGRIEGTTGGREG
ncbi:ABC transporter ATP-binding protein [Halobacteriales archaeon QS_8_69_26]|nr:MAG: ABC transporter ATP-binding protein [Halobacteriales archaeon QS_8_69_26]